MATLGNGMPTFADIAKEMDPNGMLSRAVDIISQDNTVIQDGTALMANNFTSHRSTGVKTKPAGSFRSVNEGVGIEKSTTTQADDPIGMLETFLQQDEALVNMSPNPRGYRAQQDLRAMSGFGDTMAHKTFYADPNTTMAEFKGFMPRYNALANGQVIGHGGTGADQSSIWAVTWDADACHYVYPRGSRVGMQMRDRGTERVTDSGGTNTFIAYVTHAKWDLGLVVEDYRKAARLCNIDQTAMATWAVADRAALVVNIIKLLAKIKNRKAGKTLLYMPTDVKTQLDIHAQEKGNVNLSVQTFAGEPTLTCHGAPIREADTLMVTEAQVS